MVQLQELWCAEKEVGSWALASPGAGDGGSPSHAAPPHTHRCLAIPLHPFPLRRRSSQSGRSLS